MPRSAVDVTDVNFHEYVAGAVIVNDCSARDVQVPEMLFYKGKSFRPLGRMGSRLALFDAEGVPLLEELTLRETANGPVRQLDSTANLVPGDLVEASIRSEDGPLDLGVQQSRIVGES